MQQNVLHLLYPPQETFITRYKFDDQNHGITVTCRIPDQVSYTTTKIPYVTAEQYVRCLSQASYLLVEHLLRKKILLMELTVEEFLQAATEWRIFYRQIAMSFHELVSRNEEFKMRLTLKNVQQIRRFEEFTLFTFENHRVVISGSMSFICRR